MFWITPRALFVLSALRVLITARNVIFARPFSITVERQKIIIMPGRQPFGQYERSLSFISPRRPRDNATTRLRLNR